MTADKTINRYIETLSRYLSALPINERSSITDEIRMHLEARAQAGRLDEALSKLGTPETCAQAYLEELSISQHDQLQATEDRNPNVLAKIWGRVSAFSGFLLMGFLYLLTAAFVFSLGYEILNPSHSGLWVQGGHLHWGTTSGTKYDIDQEILGFWFIPINIALILGFFFLAEKVGRFSKHSVQNNW